MSISDCAANLTEYVLNLKLMDKLSLELNNELSQRGLSMRELARRSHVSVTTISGIISQQIDASADVCVKLANALDIDPARFLRLEGHLPSLSPTREMEESLLFEWRNIEPAAQAFILRILRGLRAEKEVPLRGGGMPNTPAAHERSVRQREGATGGTAGLVGTGPANPGQRGETREMEREGIDVSQLLGKATLNLDNPYRIAYEVLYEQVTPEQKHAFIRRLIELAYANETGRPSDVEKPEPDAPDDRRVRTVPRGSPRATKADG